MKGILYQDQTAMLVDLFEARHADHFRFFWKDRWEQR